MDSHGFFEKLNQSITRGPEDELLSTEEVMLLIMSFATARGDIGFSEEESFKVIKWAEGVRIGESLLDITLKGLALVDWNGTDVTFRLTEDGKDALSNYRTDIKDVAERENNGFN